MAADPTRTQESAEPGGWGRIVYCRLHDHPKIYYSAYSGEHIASLARHLQARSRRVPVWCIFDNTATGAATDNALTLMRLAQ